MKYINFKLGQEEEYNGQRYRAVHAYFACLGCAFHTGYPCSSPENWSCTRDEAGVDLRFIAITNSKTK